MWGAGEANKVKDKEAKVDPTEEGITGSRKFLLMCYGNQQKGEDEKVGQ